MVPTVTQRYIEREIHREEGRSYVYVERLLSYVDLTPYCSSLYLNMSLGSQPLDWRNTERVRRVCVSLCVCVCV